MIYIISVVILLTIVFLIKNNRKKNNINIIGVIDKWEAIFLSKGLKFKRILNPESIKVRDLYDQFGSIANRKCVDIGGKLFPFGFGYKDNFGNRLEDKSLSVENIDKLYNVILESENLKSNLIKEYGVEKANALINKEYIIGETTKNEIQAIRGFCLNIKTEQLKTKTKTSFYYGHDKASDFYVFDDDILVKFVDKISST